MCYAIPAKLIEIKGHIGVVDYFGEKKNVLMDLGDVEVGDYLFAQGGVMVRKVDTGEALEILELWRDIFHELKKTDIALSRLDNEKVSENILGILQKVNLRKSLKKEEMVELFSLDEKAELSVLYEVANNVRQRQHGNASCVHGIIEFSNYCHRECNYCGIRCSNIISRYRMTPNEIVNVANHAVVKHGFKALVLQSGEDLWYDDEKLCEIVSRVRKLGVLVFISIGQRSRETYRKLYEAGARAALIRFETSNSELFAKMRPGTTLEERIALIEYVQSLGYVVATGFLLGLPGERVEDVINNIAYTKYLAPDMYSFGPLIPTKGTPLKDHTVVEKDYVLKTIAISRMCDANANILVTTALETLDLKAKRDGLLAGANSLMINVTPSEYKKMYNIYDGRAGEDTGIDAGVKGAVDLLLQLGRAPTDLGDIRLFSKHGGAV